MTNSTLNEDINYKIDNYKYFSKESKKYNFFNLLLILFIIVSSFSLSLFFNKYDFLIYCILTIPAAKTMKEYFYSNIKKKSSNYKFKLLFKPKFYEKFKTAIVKINDKEELSICNYKDIPDLKKVNDEINSNAFLYENKSKIKVITFEGMKVNPYEEFKNNLYSLILSFIVITILLLGII